MFRIGSVNCDDFKQLCDKEEMTEFPSYKVYPPIPVPPFEVKQTSDSLDTDTLKKACYRFVGNRVIDINSNNVKTFLEDNPSKPKMLLFTETKSAPMVYRALSTYFDKTLEFGMVKKEDEALAKQYKVKKFPTFMLLKNNQKPIVYEDTEYSYHKLFEWINVYSETFVFVGDKEGQQEVKSKATKAWLNMNTPYLSTDSADDICLKKDASLCVIYVAPH